LQQTWYPGAATWQSAVVVQFMAHEPPFWQTPCAASSGSLTGQQTWPCAVLQSELALHALGQLFDGMQTGVV
jgi:hypothetical protein